MDIVAIFVIIVCDGILIVPVVVIVVIFIIIVFDVIIFIIILIVPVLVITVNFMITVFVVIMPPRTGGSVVGHRAVTREVVSSTLTNTQGLKITKEKVLPL